MFMITQRQLFHLGRRRTTLFVSIFCCSAQNSLGKILEGSFLDHPSPCAPNKKVLEYFRQTIFRLFLASWACTKGKRCRPPRPPIAFRKAQRERGKRKRKRGKCREGLSERWRRRSGRGRDKTGSEGQRFYDELSVRIFVHIHAQNTYEYVLVWTISVLYVYVRMYVFYVPCLFVTITHIISI